MDFDLEKLKELCDADVEELFFSDWGFANVVRTNSYVYIDNNSSVLAVVHLDTVRELFQVPTKNVVTKIITPKKEFDSAIIQKLYCRESQITSVGLDDRLGLYFITQVLPSLGINVDILMTTEEEKGRSSASEFVANKKYNWMFQFDRHGYGNVVMYQYDTHKLTCMLESYGYTVQMGTFSDISELGFLGCSGFNFGCGYLHEHTNFCFTRTDWMEICINMFVDFYWENKDTEYLYVEDKYSRYTYRHREWYYEEDEIGVDYSTAGTSIKKAIVKRYCKMCECELLSNEKDYCIECLEFVKSFDTCVSCGGEFSIDDLDDEGYCYDCRKFLDSQIKGEQ